MPSVDCVLLQFNICIVYSVIHEQLFMMCDVFLYIIIRISPIGKGNTITVSL